MSKKYKVPQVFYGSWNDDLLPEHENYWWDIDTIAAWIGYALIGGSHGCRVELSRYNTIHVSQTKEKFGGVRVYCYFASEEQVQEEYKKTLTSITDQNRKYFAWKQGSVTQGSLEYPTPYRVRCYEEKGMYPLSQPDFDEFRAECAITDARHYRHIYHSAVKLWPHYESAIIDSASFYEYLFNTESELDDSYDKRRKNIEKSDYFTDEQKKEQVASLEDDLKRVKSVCGFTKEGE